MTTKFKPYPKYRFVDVPWLGTVPDYWDLKPLFTTMNEIDNKNYGNKVQNVLSLSYGKIVDRDVESNYGLLPESFETYQIVEKGDVVLRLTDLQNDQRSLRVGSVGRKGIITSAYVCLRGLEGAIIPEYAFRLLAVYDFKKVFYGLGSGVRQVMGFGDLKRMPVILPKVEEQKRIVSFLGQIIPELDGLVIKKLKLIELLKEKRMVLVNEAIKSKDTRRMRLKHLTNEMIRPVNRNVEEEFVPIGLYNWGRGIFHKEPTLGVNLGDSDFYWVKSEDLVISGQFAWEGAVALADADDDGCVASHRYPIIRGKPDLLDTAYLYAFLTTPMGSYLLNENSRGAAGRNRPINLGTLMKEEIAFPSMEAQLRISKHVHYERWFGKVIKRSIELINEYKRVIISDVVTGKIDLRDWKSA